MATCSPPDVIRTASGFHRLKALMGPPDHERQELQWQYPIASGDPVTSILTAPQKHFPVKLISSPRFSGTESNHCGDRASWTAATNAKPSATSSPGISGYRHRITTGGCDQSETLFVFAASRANVAFGIRDPAPSSVRRRQNKLRDASCDRNQRDRGALRRRAPGLSA